jgi:hypothetical protein
MKMKTIMGSIIRIHIIDIKKRPGAWSSLSQEGVTTLYGKKGT